MAATNLSVYGPAPVDKDGVLAAFVQQPVANTPSEISKFRIVYTEKWKGPYETGKEILSKVTIGENLKEFHTALGNTVSRFTTPASPVRENLSSYWQIAAIKVDEHTAGDHCFITVDCEANFGLSAEQLIENTDANTWSVTWQSYSVTPYEFASGEVHAPIVVTGNQQISADWEAKASRTIINQYLSHNPDTTSNVWTWTPNPKQPQIKNALAGAEMELLKKINQNRNATYHYPIVTHQTQFYGKSGSTFITHPLGSDLDVVTNLPSDCPYTFSPIMSSTSSDNWTWLKIGDDMQQTRTANNVTFTRTERWAGYNDVDENYYGKKAFVHNESGIKTGRWYKNCL